ncbi:acylphosphatase [Oceanobacillus sp. J11TS1]|uniref:acylphosphatase n=1 Tax=Oceanobacillus sp. J11TS1 TaxID=2807191 RepID=UPI001B22FE04|nr:acylphosphatase [Oceanobacillus sp. J11TS1]GIO23429.1 hypothetical protein J11TS1_20100 [Oceanobacillus sp. J11TS1]
MEEKDVEWLPHLSDEIVADARGYLLDAYTVALEGWRRGLTLRWHVKDSEKFTDMKTWNVDKPGKLFSLESKERSHFFFRTRGDKVTNQAVEVCADKEKTKDVLSKMNIRVPNGKRFYGEELNEAIIQYASKVGYPVVIKPADGSFGRGVISNIKSRKELLDAINYVRDDLKYRDVILEEYIPGDEFRLYVVGDKVVGAIQRIPAHIVGDGKHSIKALVDLKNKERKSNPRLISCPIIINEEVASILNQLDYTLGSIPKDGEQLFLSKNSNISLGGDPVDVLDELQPAIKKVAVQAVQAVEGLNHGAVDLIIKPNKEAVVLELNATAQIGGLLYPVKGKSRDIPAAIIDYYFPETKSIANDKSKTYFDFHDVLRPLNSRSADVTTVTPAQMGKLYAKKYTVIGNVQDIGFHRGLRKQAFEHYLHGFILNLENGNIEIVVAGTDKEMIEEFKNTIWEDPERGQVREVHESFWDEPVKVGFEVKADLKTQVEQLKNFQQELEVTEHALRKAESKNKQYHDSLSWKVSKPIRQLGGLIKNIKK